VRVSGTKTTSNPENTAREPPILAPCPGRTYLSLSLPALMWNRTGEEMTGIACHARRASLCLLYSSRKRRSVSVRAHLHSPGRYVKSRGIAWC
jgi:hypothetical protein